MKKNLVKLIIGLVLIGISIAYLNAVIAFNDPLSPFPAKTSIQVGDMITDSASELLQSASEAFLFLNEVEIAGKNGLNVGSALQRVDMAAARVEQAMNLFKNIIAVGSEAGYEKNRIGKLMDFSYGQFARDNGLSEETMNEVSAYLAKGNVLGFYRRHVRNLQKLLNTLQFIKTDLLAGKLSENQVLWSLLQQYSSTMMFGNYASLVFYKI
ncbi:MAG: hypothetical protein ABII93_00225 [Chrysiogenia bacterium]